MINVLLITYYWPPAGGGGVHRWLKMSKYLVNEKINLTVYTPENPEYPAIDESGLKQVDERIKVIKRPILEPYSFYKSFTGKNKKENIYSGFINEKASFTQKLSTWIRGNFFIPDARFLWIKPSIKYLNNYIKNNPTDVIISTGPPHSMHMIALGVKKRNQTIKWISDFRDPWTNIDFYDKLKLTHWADKKHHRLEKEVLQKSDKVVAIGYTMKKELDEIRGSNDVELITNGYDHQDFQQNIPLSKKCTITHLGSMNADRNPLVLWNALELINNSAPELLEDVEINLIGNVDLSIKNSIEEKGLGHLVNYQSFVNHSEAIKIMQSSHALLLMINNSPNAKGILTGKGFEYLGSTRPIICIGPHEGDMKELFQEFNHVHYLEYSEEEKCIAVIKKIINKSMDNSSVDSMKYSRKNLAIEYAELIKNLAS